jgi:uncharacterized protein (DUF58 family)
MGVLGLAAVSFLFWLFTRGQPQLLLTIALVLAAVLDLVTSHQSLATAALEVHNPVDGIVGHDLTYFVRMPGNRRPVLVRPPGAWGVAATPVVIDDDQPGAMVLTAPPRGVIRYLIFELTARGPLGLSEAVRRVRVWLPTPMYIGPVPLEHDVDWSAVRAARLGSYEFAPQGDDLFRGVRPYTPGDSPRSVHWPASAHHGGLMVKESDGTGVLALRIVLNLTEPGMSAEHAAGRAAWLAEQGLRRGWLVQLVTTESTGRPPTPAPLGSATGRLPPSPPAPAQAQTANRRVRSRRDILRQLAVAGYGGPDLETWSGITRLVEPWGDSWL